jgi:hypothetical protein
MKKDLKLKQFSSNKAIYSQTIFYNKVVSTKKGLINNLDTIDSKLLLNITNISSKEILSLYNNNIIKYNTFKYILLLNNINNSNTAERKKITNQINIEYSIESGLY